KDADTIGGNALFDHGRRFHSHWDAIPGDLGDDASTNDNMKQRARDVTPTTGPVEGFAATWASESVQLSRSVFSGTTFTRRPPAHPGDDRTWDIHLPPASDQYWQVHDETKRQQLAKAGARLAELLNAIWP